MKISNINEIKYKNSFKSARTDRAAVSKLKTGENPITENEKLNIYAALNNLKEDGNNAEFLLDIADNLAYGQNRGSEFEDILNKDGLTPPERENTDWSKLLEDTVRAVISSSAEDVSDLESEYKRIFNTKKPLSEEQKKLLAQRKLLTNAVSEKSSLDDADSMETAARIRKNLDYFTASSEISFKEKSKCLDKFIYFLSDDYKITPQLKNKKLQAVDEMLNDILIKTPENPELTIKSVNQRCSGICAAISICRKAAAYEDKAGFIDMITEELKESPYMSVYDITELGTGKKVNIEKIDIDYNTALARGYRIIDASAHQWMNNAHAGGNGTIQTEQYIPFDDENYGIFDDSSWYLGLDSECGSYKSLLQALIKEKEFLEAFNKTKKSIKDITNNISSVKKEVFTSQSAAYGKLNSIFKEIFPEKTNLEISHLIKSLTVFYSGSTEENEVNVPSKLPNEAKQNILTDFIIKSMPEADEYQQNRLQEKSLVVLYMLEEYKEAEDKLRRLNSCSGNKNKYIYNKKLFNIAAAHRIAAESDLNLPDGELKFEHALGLEPYYIRALKYIKSCLNEFYPQEKAEEGKSSERGKELLSDYTAMSVIIPAQLNSISKSITGVTLNELTAQLFKNYSDKIKQGDKNALENFKAITKLDCDKKEIIKKADNISNTLLNNPSYEQVEKSISLLGFGSAADFLEFSVSSYLNSIKDGISKEDYNRLADTFGGEENISSGIEAELQNLEKTKQKYNDILKNAQVPSPKTMILMNLEEKNLILSRRKLDKLKHKFDASEAAVLQNEKILNSKERAKANNKLYNFSAEEKEIFRDIEKNLPFMKKYCKTAYNNINDILFYDLEEQYSDIGMLNGQFWVREEGSSGLASNEQVRIIEQMTGRPCHIETDVLKAAEQIKKGGGSGILSLSVDDKDYAFHAQYVPAVTSETFISPETKEKIHKDVMWTDNSWGNCERESFWNGRNGFNYTDYQRGYGWKDGFILADDGKIGLKVEEIFLSTGIAEEDNEKFALFLDVVLPGMPANGYQKLYEMFNCIINSDEDQIMLEKLEKALKEGSKININALESLDDIEEMKSSIIKKRIENTINSRADFDKLSEDDIIKFMFKKVSYYLAADNPECKKQILEASDNKELETAIKAIRNEQCQIFMNIAGKSDYAFDLLFDCSIDEFKRLYDELAEKFGLHLEDEEQNDILEEIFFNEELKKEYSGRLADMEEYLCSRAEKASLKHFKKKKAAAFFMDESRRIITKNIDENLKIKSLESPILKNNPLSSEFTAVMDKYHQPKSDEELLSYIQEFQNADYTAADKFMEKLTLEDLGIIVKEPYYYLELFKAENTPVCKAFDNLFANYAISSMLKTSDREDDYSPDELYRHLYVSLADMDVQKYINAFKAEAFQKYQVRQAFPQPVVITDDKIQAMAENILSIIKENIDAIEDNQYIIDVLTTYSKFIDNFSDGSIYKSLINKRDIQVNSDNEQSINEFSDALFELYNLTSDDEMFDVLNEALKKLISLSDTKNGYIDGKNAGAFLKFVIAQFKNFERSGLTESACIQKKKEMLKEFDTLVQSAVNIDIEPRYTDEAMKEISKLTDMYRKDKSDDEIIEQEEKITDLFIQKHITKNPTELLKKYISLCMNGKTETQEAQLLRDYLSAVLKCANQTQIQYKLVQNQHEGISSKIKEMLSMFEVESEDGTIQTLDSEQGMLYLIQQLANEDDNHVTLNLFLNQAGLSKQAARAIINNTNFEDLYKEFSCINEFETNIFKLDKIAEISKEFISKNIIKHLPVKSAVTHLNSYVKLKSAKYKDDVIFKTYTDFLDETACGIGFLNVNPALAAELLTEINSEAIINCTEVLNAALEKMQKSAQNIYSQMFLLDTVNIPQNCEEYEMREKTFDEYEKLQTFIETQNQKIKEIIEKSKFLDAEIINTGIR